MDNEIKVFHVCSHCNKEYELKMYPINTIYRGGIGHNFDNCPLCKKRNDIWIRIEKVKNDSN